MAHKVLDTLRRPVLCVVGPTATGKSELGVALAQVLDGEVISADSMQVYRGMDIGTAKLTKAEMNGIPHHLIDVVNPDQSFSVAQWAQCAMQAIGDMHGRGKLPIVVGGTGLYVRAVTDGLRFAEQSASSDTRRRWQAYAEQYGNQRLHDELARRDPASALRLHANDSRRVIRALEVWELQGEPLSTNYDWSPRTGQFDAIQIGLYVDRARLYERVNARVQRMVARGLRDEVAGLMAHGYGISLTSMQAIGYKEMAAAIRSDVSEQDAVEGIKQATRRLVKRQLSWFMRDSRIVWVNASADEPISRTIPEILKTIQWLAAGFPSRISE